MDELITTLQRLKDEGATLEACTIVLKKDYRPFVVTSDWRGEINDNEVTFY